MEYYVCNICSVDRLVKVYCQRDKSAVDKIQELLQSYTARFDSGVGSIRDPSDITTFKVLAVKSDKYYRGTAIGGDNRIVVVKLIDFGTIIHVPINNVRIINFPPFNEYPDEGYAYEFILHDVTTFKPWSPDDYSIINYILQHPLETTVVKEIMGKHLVRVDVPSLGGDLSEILYSKNMAIKTDDSTMEKTVRSLFGNRTYSSQRTNELTGSFISDAKERPILSPSQSSREAVVPHDNQAYMYQHVQVMPDYQKSISSYEFNSQANSTFSGAFSRPVQQTGIGPPQHQNSAPVQSPVQARIAPIQANVAYVQPSVTKIQNFSPVVLKNGVNYPVRVSQVLDGPASFCVQLQSDVDNNLPVLTVNINASPRERINGPILPGTSCLAATPEQTLCRGVVSAVKAKEASVYLVDFGNTLSVPLNHIYKIQPEFMRFSAMASNVTLAGLNDRLLTSTAQNRFSSLVVNKCLILELKEMDEFGKYFVELYYKEKGKLTNVKEEMQSMEYERIVLTRDMRKTVTISHVNTLKDFYVRLAEHEHNMQKMMASLHEYCVSTEFDALLLLDELRPGLPVCAMFSDDQKWYRAMITDAPVSHGDVTVQFVDYGNIDNVSLESLLKMPPEFLKLRALAIHCLLDDEQTTLEENDDYIIDMLAELVEDLKLELHVLKVLSPDKLLVHVNVPNDGKSVMELLQDYINETVDKKDRSSAAPSVSWETSIVKHIPVRSTSLNNEGSAVEKYGKQKNDDDDNNKYRKYEPRRNEDETTNNRYVSDSSRKNWRADSASNVYSRNDGDQRYGESKRDYRGGGGGQTERFRNRFEDSHDSFRSDRGGVGSRKPYHKNEFDEEKSDRNSWYRGSNDNRRDNRPQRNVEESDGDKEHRYGDRKADNATAREGTGWNRSDKSAGWKNNATTSFGGDSENWDNNVDTKNDFKDDGNKEHRYGDRKADNATAREGTGWNRSDKSAGWKNNATTSFGGDSENWDNNVDTKNDFKDDGNKEHRYGDRKADNATAREGTSWNRSDKSAAGWKTNATTSFGGDSENWDNNVDTMNDFKDSKTADTDWNDNVNNVVYSHPKKNNDRRFDRDSSREYKKFERDSSGGFEKKFERDSSGGFEKKFERNSSGGFEKKFERNSSGGFEKKFERNSSSGFEKKFGDRKTDSRVFEKEPELLDSFSVGSSFSHPELFIGDSFQVCITYIENPSLFYAQITDSEFEQLMVTIQSEYKARKPISSEFVKSGTHVIVENSQDNLLYRATVLSVNHSDVTVRLLDYGETVACKKNQIWAVSADHCVVPIRAICCGLKDFVAKSETEIRSLDVYFEDDSYTLNILDSVVNVDDNIVYHVELLNEAGQSAIQRLIDDGHAEAMTKKDKIEDPIDLFMLLDQTVLAYSVWYESCEKFYIHIDTEKASHIESTLEKVDVSKLTKLPSEEVVEDLFCIVKDDGVLYRASILSVGEANKVRVRYVDYGDEAEAELEELYAIPKDLLRYHGQVVECGLYDVNELPADDDRELKKTLEGMDIIIRVNKVEEHRLYVTLFNTSGCPLVAQQTTESIKPVVPMSVLRFKESVIISNLMVEQNVLIAYVNFVRIKSALQELQSSLIAYYDSDEQQCTTTSDHQYAIGNLCAVKYAETNQWFRARILSIEQSTVVTVYYIDYGQTATVSIDFVRQLNDQFYYPNELCLAVSTGICLNNQDDDGSLVRDLLIKTTDVVFDAEFARNNNNNNNNNNNDNASSSSEWRVNLRADDVGKKRLIDYVKQIAAAESFQEQSTSNEIISSDNSCLERWLCVGKTNVTVIHAKSPSSFWIRLNERESEFNAIQQSLESVTKSSSVFTADASHCGLFIAKFGDRWYRAELANKIARAIDFGYSSVVEENRPVLLKWLPSQFRQSEYAIACTLDIEPVDGVDDWTADARDRFATLSTNSTSLTGEIILVNSSIGDGQKQNTVRLYTEDGSDIGDLLITETLAGRTYYDVVVCHIENVVEFYIQLVTRTDELTALSERLAAADCFNDDDGMVVIGDLVAAKFKEDELWYRAIVTSIEEEQYRVEFIDYGNRSLCDEVKRLPDELISVARFAIKCRLFDDNKQLYVPAIDEQSTNAKFTELIAKHENAISVEFSSSFPESRLVSLYVGDDWQSVADLLLPTDDDSSELRVVVTHINGPASFYIQNRTDSSSSDYLNSLSVIFSDAKKMDQLPKVVHSTVSSNRTYVARYPNGQWYRVTVVDDIRNDQSGDDNDYKVFAIDYGYQTSIEPSSDDGDGNDTIRELPLHLESIPPQAVHCSLVLPSDLSVWPESAVDQFRELCASNRDDESLIFEMKVVQRDTDPLVVSLSDNGSPLSEELATLCTTDSLILTEKLKRTPVTVTHVDSLSRFSIQIGNVADVQEMHEELSCAAAATFDAISSDVQIGTLIAAFDNTTTNNNNNNNNNHGKWRRGEIRAISSDGNCYTVRCIDYGNVIETDTIKQLPDDLKSLPPLAKECSLKLPADKIESWSEEHLDTFLNLLHTKHLSLYLDKIITLENDTNTVSLRSDYFDVSSYLIEPLSSHHTDGNKVMSESGWYVSYYNSMSDFYIISSEDRSDRSVLETTEELLRPNEVEKGAIVGVIDDADNKTYRAKMLLSSTENDGAARVFRIDVGDTITCTKLYKLSGRLAYLPPLAKRCSLILPPLGNLTEWPDYAVRRFSELFTSDTDSCFDVKFESFAVDDNNEKVNLIHMRLHDEDVATYITTPVVHQRRASAADQTDLDVLLVEKYDQEDTFDECVDRYDDENHLAETIADEFVVAAASSRKTNDDDEIPIAETTEVKLEDCDDNATSCLIEKDAEIQKAAIDESLKSAETIADEFVAASSRKTNDDDEIPIAETTEVKLEDCDDNATSCLIEKDAEIQKAAIDESLKSAETIADEFVVAAASSRKTNDDEIPIAETTEVKLEDCDDNATSCLIEKDAEIQKAAIDESKSSAETIADEFVVAAASSRKTNDDEIPIAETTEVKLEDCDDNATSCLIEKDAEIQKAAIDESVPKDESLYDDYVNNGDQIVKTAYHDNIVVVSHANSPASFYVQRLNSRLGELVELLKSAEETFVAAAANDVALLNSIIAVKFDEDETWRRARVLATKVVDDESISVIFIDYGNTYTVTNSDKFVRQLPENVASIPPLAMHCCLADLLTIDYDDQSLAAKIEAEFEELTIVGNPLFFITIITEDADPAIVTMKNIDSGTNMSDLVNRFIVDNGVVEEKDATTNNYDNPTTGDSA